MKKTRRIAACALAGLAMLLAGCALSGHVPAKDPRDRAALVPTLPPPAPVEPAQATLRVIQITLDGARWQEVFTGVDPGLARAAGLSPAEVVPADALLPEIYRNVVARGVALGAPGRGVVEASGPVFVSLPGYMELLLGARSGCGGNDCAAVDRPTILDELASQPGALLGDVALISSWDGLDKAAAADPSRIAISTGRRGGRTRDSLRVDPTTSAALDDGQASAAFPGEGDYRPDAITARLALGFLSVRRPTFLHVGLGDTDEHAHRGDYAGYLAALRLADRFVGELVETLRRRGDLASTTLLITADHGRARDFRNHGKAPESARVFVLAAGGGVPTVGFAVTPDPLHLADVAPTLRTLLGLSASRAITSLLPLPRGGPPGRG